MSLLSGEEIAPRPVLRPRLASLSRPVPYACRAAVVSLYNSRRAFALKISIAAVALCRPVKPRKRRLSALIKPPRWL
jgi:hypothetical protein